MKKENVFIDPNVARKNKLRYVVETERISANEPPLFSWIEFNLSGSCNRRCDFCPWSNPEWRSSHFQNVTDNNGGLHLPTEVYEDVMKDLNKVGYKGAILYSGLSEPFLYRHLEDCLLYTSPSPRDVEESRMPSSA